MTYRQGRFEKGVKMDSIDRIEKHLRNLIKNAKRNGCEDSFINGVTSSLDAVLMERKFVEDVGSDNNTNVHRSTEAKQENFR